LERARSLNAVIASSAATVAKNSTIVDIVVRTDQDAVDCIAGMEGVLDGARPGTLVLLHSTILPQTTRELAKIASERDVHIMDACMVAVPSAVREDKLSFFVGGPPELVERARPHLLNMGKQVLHMGPLGTGNIAKLIKNLVNGAETLIVHEAIQIGLAGGIPYKDSLDMMRKTFAGTILNRWESRFDASGANPEPLINSITFEKDIPLAGELARTYGLHLPITEQIVNASNRFFKPITS
jgi:3-hydroxyisobutyrate dehydrogenase-like beta-hydroxyacid dehydrogenase